MKSRAFFIISIVLATAILYFNQGRPNPPEPLSSHWIKLDKQGQAMPHWAGPWACILDTKTGLVWENKTDDEGVHDGAWSYSWLDQNGLGVENWGDCRYEVERCDTQDLIRKMQQEQSCGLSNWRLPSKRELLSLVIDYQKQGEPVIDTGYFPYSKRGDYWTSNAHQPLTGINRHLKTGAIAINFINGEAVATPYRNAAYVRLVTSDISKQFIDEKRAQLKKY